MVLISYILDVVVAVEMNVTARFTSDITTLVGNCQRVNTAVSDLL
jgi:hypothetical protein